MMRLWTITLLLLCALLSAQPGLAQEAVALALFDNAALIELNGKQQLLRVGQTGPGGVRLVSANPSEAVLEVDGERLRLTLDRRISGQYRERGQLEVSIGRNSRSQYLTPATINGQTITVLVDTGANTVAMSATHARRLGLDYQRGEPRSVATASGISAAYAVNLREVDVGGITAHNVAAVVIAGEFPMQVLLGTSYLEHVHIREQDGVMYLKEKY